MNSNKSKFVKVDKRRAYGSYQVILTSGDKTYVYDNLTGRQAATLERTLEAKYARPDYEAFDKKEVARNNKKL